MTNENDPRDLDALTIEIVSCLGASLLAVVMILILIFTAKSVLAEQPINLVRVVDSDAPTYSEVQNSLAIVNTFLQRELKITLIEAREYEYLDSSKYGLEMSQYYDGIAFNYWENQCRADSILRAKDRLTLAILPPSYSGKTTFTGGMAWVGRVGIKAPFAVVMCGHSYQACSIAVAHEVLHSIGAQHTRNCQPNIMDVNPLQLGSGAFVMQHRTKKQIERHLRAVKLWEMFRR
jgi:hypothetical protein